MCTATIPFCLFAKMTKWYAPEPKKSSTSLRLRRSTSCDRSDDLRVNMIEYGPSSISADLAYSREPPVELWSSALPPRTNTPHMPYNPPLPPFQYIISSSSPVPLLHPFLSHRNWALLFSDSVLDVARKQEVVWSDPFKHMDYRHCHYLTGLHSEDYRLEKKGLMGWKTSR